MITAGLFGYGPALALTATAGTDLNVADTDQQPGELVALNGSGNIPAVSQHIPPGHMPGPGECRLWFLDRPPGHQPPAAPCRELAGQVPAGAILLGNSIVSYQWLNSGNQQIATGASASVRLPDGQQIVTLVVTDATGATATDTINVHISAGIPIPPAEAVALRAEAGPDRRISDTDSQDGEDVMLDGSASAALNGRITIYQWLRAGVPIATGATATVRLADGNNLITLLIFDESGESASDAIQISVGRALARQTLSSLPNLTPNQHSVAQAMDAMCGRLQDRQSALVGDQRDLLVRCQAIVDSTSTEQVTALDAIAPEELNSVSTETFNLSRLQLTNVTDRLIALRAGAEGLSLAGLRLDTDSQSLPMDTLVAGVQELLGGGASADEAHKPSNARRRHTDRPLGVWMRGNIGAGRKNTNSADRGFDSELWGVVGGIDYRFASNKVVGLAAGYGHSSASFNPIGAGSLDTDVRTAALYTTIYTRRGFYFDAIVSYLQADYESLRGVSFTERASLLDLAARGNTTGSTYSGSLNIGLDQTYWGFTIGSNFGVSCMLTNIGAFREHGAAGLDLMYEEQQYTTSAANAGLRLSYAWKTDIGVFVPQIRGEYIHEFSDSAQRFDVRFANDPFEDSPQIVIDGEVPDRSYWRMAAGLSAQLGRGISGFIEHQRLQSHLHIRYTDTVMGVRFESAFQ